MTESREAPEAPQVETLENPNALPAASRESMEATTTIETANSEPLELEQSDAELEQSETLDDPHELRVLNVEPAGETVGEDVPIAPPPAPAEAQLEQSTPETLDNPHAPEHAAEPAGSTLEPPLENLPDVTTGKLEQSETFDNPHETETADSAEPAGNTVEDERARAATRATPAELGRPVRTLPRRPRLRVTCSYGADDAMVMELTLMDERRELIHRMNLTPAPDSPLGKIFEGLVSLVARSAAQSGIFGAAPAAQSGEGPPD